MSTEFSTFQIAADGDTGDLVLRYGEVVESSYILIAQSEPPVLEFFGEGKSTKCTVYFYAAVNRNVNANLCLSSKETQYPPTKYEPHNASLKRTVGKR